MNFSPQLKVFFYHLSDDVGQMLSNLARDCCSLLNTPISESCRDFLAFNGCLSLPLVLKAIEWR